MKGEIQYLEHEDAAFAHAFNLSEEQVLECYGGLKNYTQHRLDRNDARQAFVGDSIPGVPHLPLTPEEALKHYHLSDPKLTDAGIARELIREQVQKVKGINQAVKADRELKQSAVRAKKDDDARVRMEAVRIARTYPDYPGDSGQRCLGMSDEQASAHKREIEAQQEACIARAIREVKSRRR